jgi:Raf kinase inhibitor-like YbhB/YbcL family protein
MKTLSLPVARYVAVAITTGWATSALAADPEPGMASDMTRAEATHAAEVALAACAARGQPASVVVMDADGRVRVQFSDDGAKPIGLTTSNGKAAAVLLFKESTRDLVARLQGDPQFAAQYGQDARFHFSPGGLPIYKQGKFVGLIAVGGARNIDEDCALEGLKTIAWASTPTSEWAVGHAMQLALVAAPATSSTPLKVTSPAFKQGGKIPSDSTQYGANLFPGLAWNKGPHGTKSYVVVMQGDPVAGSATSIHLTLFNIPSSTTRLAAGMKDPPQGATWGPNVHGLNQTYAGPHPHTQTEQRYHLQVFALDTQLGVNPQVEFAALEAALNGHVLASGELVGVAAGPAAAVPAADAPAADPK